MSFRKYNEITEKIYDYYLGVVPPRAMLYGNFLVGEASSTNSQGYTTYQACFQIGYRYFASVEPMSLKEFQEVLHSDILANVVQNDNLIKVD